MKKLTKQEIDELHNDTGLKYKFQMNNLDKVRELRDKFKVCFTKEMSDEANSIKKILGIKIKKGCQIQFRDSRVKWFFICGEFDKVRGNITYCPKCEKAIKIWSGLK